MPFAAKEITMGCRWCVHWVCDDKYVKDFGFEGECRRFPVPVATISEYRCGEFLCEPDFDGTTRMQGFYERMHGFREDSDNERSKRIALEKKNKALREKLKRLQAKPSPAKPAAST
jgi:hypothetical protein